MNKYPRRRDDEPVVPDPDLFAGVRTQPRKFAKWKCLKCTRNGMVPELLDGIAPMIDNIERAHSRSQACHEDRGMKHVYVVYLEKSMQFSAFVALLPSREANSRPREFSPL